MAASDPAPRWEEALRAAPVAAGRTPSDLPEVVVDHDNVTVSGSCRLRFVRPVADADGNGVVHVVARDAWVDLGGAALEGCAMGTAPDAMSGTGIAVRAPGVTVANGAVRGFAVAVHAQDAPGARFADLDLSGNRAARLGSTPQKEDAKDWLWPQSNDGGEWGRNYGAALWAQRSPGAQALRVTAHGGQNGIVLDRCDGARVLDCDCSFLSGWGLALWRTSGCTVARNAFDWCVRGYSHGVYNRGQDSAGILCFEQCSGNVFALNSATHCGDGFFGFAGKESLEGPTPAGTGATRPGGCDGNLLLRNDFSFAVAHGIEMTFSRGNDYVENVVEGAAICGLWGGYSQRSRAEGNRFIACGDRGYGQERGGINIEHGSGWRIALNEFRGGPMGIRLWWDDDKDLLAKDWAKWFGAESRDYEIRGNTFADLKTAIALERTTGVRLSGNSYTGCGEDLRRDDASRPSLVTAERTGPSRNWDKLAAGIPGTRTPVGARRSLGGREAIRMGEFGPVPPAK